MIVNLYGLGIVIIFLAYTMIISKLGDFFINRDAKFRKYQEEIKKILKKLKDKKTIEYLDDDRILKMYSYVMKKSFIYKTLLSMILILPVFLYVNEFLKRKGIKYIFYFGENYFIKGLGFVATFFILALVLNGLITLFKKVSKR